MQKKKHSYQDESIGNSVTLRPAKILGRIDTSVTSTQKIYPKHLPALVKKSAPTTQEVPTGSETFEPSPEAAPIPSPINTKPLLRYAGLFLSGVTLSLITTLFVNSFSNNRHNEISNTSIETAPIWSESIDEMIEYQKNAVQLAPLKPLSAGKLKTADPQGNYDTNKTLPGAELPEASTVKLAKSDNRDQLIVIPRKIREGLMRQITQKVHSVISRYDSSLSAVKMTSLIVSESLRAQFDPLLVAAVIRTESAFKHRAISSVGARGLMQIMPQTKKFIESFEAIPPGERKELFNPRYNIKLGIAYLKYLQELYNGNMSLALMAYNWGPGNLSKALRVKQGKSRVPHSVLRYAMRVRDDHAAWQSRITANLLYGE